MTKKHKHTFITWLGVYPTITLILLAIEPFIIGMPLPAVTFIVTAFAVPLVSYFIMPILQKTFHNWLER